MIDRETLAWEIVGAAEVLAKDVLELKPDSSELRWKWAKDAARLIQEKLAQLDALRKAAAP